MEPKGPSAYVAEFIGTFFLVFFIAVVLTVERGATPPYLDFAVIGLLHMLVLTMLVATLGGVSGGHFNPAVTAAIAALRKISPVDALTYVVMQLAGGVAGALVCKVLLLDEGKTTKYGAVGISDMLSGKLAAGALVELIGTFVLMWAIMGVAVNPRGDQPLAPLVIGGTLGFIVMAFGPLTGAGFNPARAFGPNLVGSAGDWGKFAVAYVAAPIVGAVLSAFTYRFVALGSGPVERPVDTLPG